MPPELHVCRAAVVHDGAAEARILGEDEGVRGLCGRAPGVLARAGCVGLLPRALSDPLDVTLGRDDDELLDLFLHRERLGRHGHSAYQPEHCSDAGQALVAVQACCAAEMNWAVHRVTVRAQAVLLKRGDSAPSQVFV